MTEALPTFHDADKNREQEAGINSTVEVFYPCELTSGNVGLDKMLETIVIIDPQALDATFADSTIVIHSDSPLGRALIGKKKGEEFEFADTALGITYHGVIASVINN